MKQKILITRKEIKQNKTSLFSQIYSRVLNPLFTHIATLKHFFIILFLQTEKI